MTRIVTLALVIGLCLSAAAQAGQLETVVADPPPDFGSPRRVILQISTDDERKINDVLYNAVNLQKFYGMDNVEIAVIVFGPGMKALYRGTSPVQERIESLLKYDVRFIGCGNTMATTNHTEADLIDGVEYVQAGVAEIVERQLAGWVYVHP
jgi:intracellular sulfur oxidation DsrE/DsrF family protein